MKTEDDASSSVRVNCNVCGDAARILHELKNRHIIDSNREAVVQGIFALQERVMKSDIEKNKLRTFAEQKVYLRPWDEIIGTLNGIETTDTDVIALLTCTLEKNTAIAIQRDSPETEQLQQQLKKLLGRRLAIFKTDNPQKPLIIRTINETKADKPIETKKQKQQSRNILLQRTCSHVICFSAVG